MAKNLESSRSDARALYSAEALIGLLRAQDNGLLRLKRVVTSGDLQAYLETRRELEEPLRHKVSALLERLRENPRLALFALRYALAPQDSLALTADVAIHSPAEIAALVASGTARRDAVIAGLRGLIGDGHLREWLGVLEMRGWERAIAAIEEAKRQYPEEKDLPVYALLWHESPGLGLPVDGGRVKSPKALAAWIDSDAEHLEQASRLLDHGWIPTWLVATGRLGHADKLKELASLGMTRAARVETLLWLLDPDLPAPQLTAEPNQLVRTLAKNSREMTLSVTLHNSGRGYAWGGVDLEGAVPGIALVTTTFDGTPADVSVRVSRADMRSSTPLELALVVRVRGPRKDQTLRVPIQLRIRGPVGVRKPELSPEPVPAQARTQPRASTGEVSRVVGAISGALIGAVMGAAVGVVFFVMAVVVLAIPMTIVGFFFSGNAVDVTLDFVGKSAVSAGIVVGMSLGGHFGASPSEDSRVGTIMMVLIASVLIGIGIANFSLLTSFVMDMTFLSLAFAK